MAAKCPPGKIRRKAYTRKDGTKVKSTCVPDKGKPGKTKKKDKVLPKLRKGVLGKYGYHNTKDLTVAQRHAALLKAVKAEGYATVMHQLTPLISYNKDSNLAFHRRLVADKDWMIEEVKPIYSKTAQRAKAGKKAASKKKVASKKKKASKKKVASKKKKASKKRSKEVKAGKKKVASKKKASKKKVASKKKKASKKRSKEVKAGKKKVAGRVRQLYRLHGSPYYKVRNANGKMGKRYV